MFFFGFILLAFVEKSELSLQLNKQANCYLHLLFNFSYIDFIKLFSNVFTILLNLIVTLLYFYYFCSH